MISGISVGFVNDIILDNSYPKISMMINENLKITRDSSISIQTDGLFGSKFLVIEIGGEEEYLKSMNSFSYVEDSILLQDLLDNIIKLERIINYEKNYLESILGLMTLILAVSSSKVY